MGKRLLIFITFLLIAGSIAGWYFFARESRYLGTSPIKAVPVESPYFVRVRDLGGLVAKTVKNSSWKSLCTFSNVAGFYSDFVFLDSVTVQNKELEKILRHKEMIFVPGDSSKLFILRIGSISEKNSINSLIHGYFQTRNIVAAGVEYKDADIQKYEWIEHGVIRKVLIVFYQGLMIASDDFYHLCSAIVQMNYSPVSSDPGFLKVKNNDTENIDLNIFINHKKFSRYLSAYFPDSMALAILRPDYAKWTEVDVIQKDNQLLMSGLTITDSTFSSYLDIFRHQKPVAGSLTQFMPSNTSYFAIQNLSDPLEYFSDYHSFLEKKEIYNRYNDTLSALSKVLNLNVEKYLNENWQGEGASVFLNYNLEQSSDNRFLLIKIKSGSNDPLVQAIKKWMSASKGRFSEVENADAAKNNILKLPCKNFGQLLGGYCFAAIPTSYMAVNDEYLLFGGSSASLKRYLNHLRRNELLINNASYVKFSSGFARTSNYFLWSAPGQSLPFFSSVFDEDSYQNLTKGISDLMKIDNVAWQWSYENGMVYNSASLFFNSAANPDPVPLWSCQFQGKLTGKPVFISGTQNSQERELVFQNNENWLVCLDKEGIEKWKIRIDGHVMGGIKMIDYYRNGDLQMIFNTRNSIHLIGGNGSEIKNFPVRLRSAATNEISVFDYDGKKNYRYLIACRDRKVYNLDKNGKLLPGWQPKATSGIVELPVRYFKAGTKDYLVYSDKKHTYIVDRQGKERIKMKDEFAHSGNNFFLIKDKSGSQAFVTTDDKGQIRFVGLDGSSRKMSVGNFSDEHIFLPVELSVEGSTEFLFADQKNIALFDLSGNLIFKKEVNILMDTAPSLIKIGNERLIELYSAAESKAVILRSDGSNFIVLLPEKCSFQTIGLFDINSSVASLVAYSPDGALYNFQMIIK